MPSPPPPSNWIFFPLYLCFIYSYPTTNSCRVLLSPKVTTWENILSSFKISDLNLNFLLITITPILLDVLWTQLFRCYFMILYGRYHHHLVSYWWPLCTCLIFHTLYGALIFWTLIFLSLYYSVRLVHGVSYFNLPLLSSTHKKSQIKKLDGSIYTLWYPFFYLRYPAYLLWNQWMIYINSLISTTASTQLFQVFQNERLLG